MKEITERSGIRIELIGPFLVSTTEVEFQKYYDLMSDILSEWSDMTIYDITWTTWTGGAMLFKWDFEDRPPSVTFLKPIIRMIEDMRNKDMFREAEIRITSRKKIRIS